jgi:hypothetical protein
MTHGPFRFRQHDERPGYDEVAGALDETTSNSGTDSEYDYLLSPFDDDNLGTVILEHCDVHTLANIVPRVCVRWRWPVLFSDKL